MKQRVTPPLAAAVFGCFLAPALAQNAAITNATASNMTTASTVSAAGSGRRVAAAPSGAVAGDSDRRLPPATRLGAEFCAFAGSSENAGALIEGLRSGSAITLTAATPSGRDGAATGTSFTAPTGPMSYGNIRVALSLAREQLAREGIDHPTPQQLQAALVGDAAAGTTGILDRRAAGMGWGRIAHDLGMKLGPVVGGYGKS
jgi:hypothetical protein